MHSFIKSLSLFFCFCSVLFISVKEAQALAKFNTTYQVYYKVGDTGLTHVTFVINQKNNLSIVYATEFGISVNETKIANLKVSDGGSPATPVVVKNENQTLISFPFVNKVVGKDKVRVFTIDYDTTDIVSKQGNTWQINIPRFETDENITEQTAILSLPANFPKPAYIDPKPDIVNGDTYYFSSKILANKPISAIFGNAQFYKGKLKYYLQNQNVSTSIQSITLPPNTSYQTLYYESIVPSPISTEIDIDGNLIANFSLNPKQELDITVSVFFKTDFLPRFPVPLSSLDYTEKTKIWDYDNNIFTIPEIKNLTTPKSIYDYVSNKLKYDYQKINESGTIRVPASSSLKNYISAICTDYTDLFVTLARRAGIKSRELEGLAVSENIDLKPVQTTKDVLHAWPEYFDETKKLWIQVDPTWGSTTRGMDYFNKLDFNHLVFAIHGTSSDLPAPAGAYKREQDSGKNIDITAIEEIAFPKNTFEVVAGDYSLQNYNFKIKNLNGLYLAASIIVPESNNLTGFQDNIYLPPFGEKVISIKQKTLSILSSNKSEVIIKVNDRDFQLPAPKQNFFQKSAFFAAGGLVLGILTLLTRSLFFRRQK